MAKARKKSLKKKKFKLSAKCKLYAKRAMAGLVGMSLLLTSTYCTLNASQLHKNWLRNKVGNSIVKIVLLDEDRHVRGGGTGFAIASPKGKKYILTNAHVCDAFKGASKLDVMLPDGKIVERKIIDISGTTDLCLVEGIEELPTISLASSVYVGEELALIGHPRLQPLTLSMGEIVGDGEVSYMMGIIGVDMEEVSCQQPKNRIVEVNSFFGPVKLCVVTIQAQLTTIVTLGGNSGSPVVNFWGHVVGVIFAGDSDANWGDMIKLADINSFLSRY